MAEYKPLTTEEREKLVMNADRDIEIRTWMDMTILRYEATVAALEAEVTEAKDNYQTMLDTACQEVKKRQELEAELARLRPLAEVGEAVGRVITDGRWLEAPDSRHETYRLWDAGVGVGNAKLVVEGKTLAELVAALPTTKGEDDD